MWKQIRVIKGLKPAPGRPNRGLAGRGKAAKIIKRNGALGRRKFELFFE